MPNPGDVVNLGPCGCCQPSSSSSGSSPSSSSSSGGCAACQRCLYSNFEGVSTTHGGCSRTNAFAGWLHWLYNPSCTQYSAQGLGSEATATLNLTGPVPVITFNFSDCTTTATYTKSSSDNCPIGTYNLTSQSDPTTTTWPATIEIFDTALAYGPSSLPPTLSVSWPAGCQAFVFMPSSAVLTLNSGATSIDPITGDILSAQWTGSVGTTAIGGNDVSITANLGCGFISITFTYTVSGCSVSNTVDVFPFSGGTFQVLDATGCVFTCNPTTVSF